MSDSDRTIIMNIVPTTRHFVVKLYCGRRLGVTRAFLIPRFLMDGHRVFLDWQSSVQLSLLSRRNVQSAASTSNPIDVEEARILICWTHCGLNESFSLGRGFPFTVRRNVLNLVVHHTIKNDAMVDEKSDLTPFDPSLTAPIETLRLLYSYPEFDGLEDENPLVIPDIIRKKIFELYGPDVPSSSVCLVTYSWTVRLKFKKYELGELLRCCVCRDTFVGAFTTSTRSISQTIAKTWYSRLEHSCILKDKLVPKYSKHMSLDPESVKPVVNRGLLLRIEGEKPDGSRADFSDLPSIEAVVFSQKIIQTDRRGHSLPGLGIPDYHPDVRVGRREGTGGLQ
ncbi:uncharacterized protein LAESUDRAFT_798417 [Laetiporus sulphureus 93-53]|uniref:Uncharacterized protein n=1 Tax=Laetiporus sulphureus 93-53 TaxID=1314785 RepID=A0A165BJP5_9APHY|nr:uncharacterized protein LAESUDRAFT_798417 [Laetiporus sulphureus 93-53]KZT01186.1 hypothetical protein LAESUDRAFT_798417 [Laetiporus sulphureus 93-53]